MSDSILPQIIDFTVEQKKQILISALGLETYELLVKNISPGFGNFESYLELSRLGTVIFCGFSMSDSPQGFKFWKNANDKIKEYCHKIC